MAFRTQDEEAAEVGYAFAQLDVRSTARHVGGDGDGSALAGLRHDFRFALVVFGVQHFMGILALLSMRESVSEASTLAVPIRMGWPLL